MNKRRMVVIGFLGMLLIGIVAIFAVSQMINNNNTEDTDGSETNVSESTEIEEYTFASLDESAYILVKDKFGTTTTIHTQECKIGLRTPFSNKSALGGSSLDVILKNNPTYIKCSECIGE